MFRSVVISHDGSRCVESTLKWLEPLLGREHSRVELFGRRSAPAAGELNSREHLEALAAEMKDLGADVEILPENYDLIGSTHNRLVVVHDPDLAIKLLRESTASLFFTPEGVSPHVPTRMLVPLDGSASCEEILPLLVPFARAFKPQVELLRVATDDLIEGRGSLMAGTAAVPTLKTLRASLERAAELLKGHGIDAKIHASEKGAVDRRIMEAASKNQADMIAISTHGHNRIARWLFGSNTETLIRSGATPILVRNTRKVSGRPAP